MYVYLVGLYHRLKLGRLGLKESGADQLLETRRLRNAHPRTDRKKQKFA